MTKVHVIFTGYERHSQNIVAMPEYRHAFATARRLRAYLKGNQIDRPLRFVVGAKLAPAIATREAHLSGLYDADEHSAKMEIISDKRFAQKSSGVDALDGLTEAVKAARKAGQRTVAIYTRPNLFKSMMYHANRVFPNFTLGKGEVVLFECISAVPHTVTIENSVHLRDLSHLDLD